MKAIVTKREKSAYLLSARRGRWTALAAAATATLLGGTAAAGPARADAPQTVTLYVCSDVPGVNSFTVSGNNQTGVPAPYREWQLNQPLDDYPLDGQHTANFLCASTQIDGVDWWWATDINGQPRTNVQFNVPGQTIGGLGGGTDIVFPFQGTSGWYDNSATFYVCFYTSQPNQDTC